MVQEMRFQALESKVPYRTPRNTPRPIIAGPQTAVVVGSKGEGLLCIHTLRSNEHENREGPDVLGLTPRQLDALRLLLLGYSNKQIARELNLSVETVKDHVAAVLRAGFGGRTPPTPRPEGKGAGGVGVVFGAGMLGLTASAWLDAVTTRSQASRIVMKYRTMSGCVTVSGPPRASWRWNSGTTLPVEPSTLPKRTVMKRVPRRRRSMAWQ